MVTKFTNKEEESKGGSAPFNTKKGDEGVDEEEKTINTISGAKGGKGAGWDSTVLDKHIKATPLGGHESEGD